MSARDRIALLATTPGDDERAVREALLSEIRGAVGFDAYAWLLTDPITCVGVAPLATIPSMAELPRLVRQKYLTRLNRWTDLPDGRVVTLVEATAGDLERSTLWRDVLRRHGVRDVASVVLRDRFGCWSFIDLWRCGRPFTAAERAFLDAVLRDLTSAVRRSLAATFALTGSPDEPSGPAVLLVSDALEMCDHTPQTDAFLRALLPTPPDRSPVPAAALNVTAQLLAVEAGVDNHPPSARLHLATGRWMQLRAARMTGTAAIAVTIEQAAPTERADVYSRTIGLTLRERALLGHLIAGHDTRGVAREMGIREGTVNDHLKSIFRKSDTNSRRQLVARSTG
jgi:DNA-binding CsgD family transcriptional regulator